MNIRPILNIRPIFWPNITFGVTAGPGDAIKQFGLACPTQNIIPGQYRPGYMVYWVLGAHGLPVEFTYPHCHGVPPLWLEAAERAYALAHLSPADAA